MFDPNTQNLSDFLQELKDTAKKAFGEHWQYQCNELLYSKMPPHLKKSINRAKLEDEAYEVIVKHLRREMELNGLESDDGPIVTMTVAKNDRNTPKKRPETQQQNTVQAAPAKLFCKYCKGDDHEIANCEKLQKKREKEAKTGKKEPFPPCIHCGGTTHSSPRCWYKDGKTDPPFKKRQNTRESDNSNYETDTLPQPFITPSSKDLN